MPDQPSGWAFESRVDPSELQIGHFVTRLDIPWSQTRFPLQGVLIDSPKKKSWMQDNCAWVVISHVRSTNKSIPTRRLPPLPGDGSRERAGGVKVASLRGKVNEETLGVARRVYESLDRQVHELAEQFVQARDIDLESAGRVVSQLVDVLDHHNAALVWLTRIKERDDYTAQHCINASILSIGLAHSLGWDHHKVEYAGLAGLLHDLGKLKIDQDILNKPGPLTDEEFEIVKQHTVLGHELITREGGLPEAVAMAVLHHHERPDGTGYPHGLPHHEIPMLARLVAIVDAYDAITSERVYDPARSHHDALGILWKQRNRQFDGPMVEAFTQYLGWVTPGTLVRLTTGQLAVVLEARDGRGLLPLVRLLEPVQGGHRLGEMLDLARMRPESGDAAVRVAEVLPDGSEGVDMRELSSHFV
ncbi:MAG: HD domain-containing protein [Gammaproteobacteria bacterium]|jgi:putative nucleotidyltransferase with HDIG domain|nr:HD domain-containing protein [Gammaproteobacteria bacterium]